MKKVLLVFSVALLMGASAYGMEKEDVDGYPLPTTVPVCVGEIVSGASQRLSLTLIRGIAERKELLRKWVQEGRKSEKGDVIIRHLLKDDFSTPEGVKLPKDQNPCARKFELTGDQLVDIWSRNTPINPQNESWKQDLQEVKEILELN